MRGLIFVSLLWIGCCREAPLYAQATAVEPITLVESKSFVWEGFANPRVVDGRLVADVTSKPKFAGSTSQILLSLDSGYTVSEIVAESLPALEYIDLSESETDGKIELQFPSDAKAGQYRIAVKAQKAGVSRQAIKRLNVTIGGSGPDAPDVDVGDMPELAKASRKAMQGLAAGMADDMDKAAAEVEAGRVKKVLDLASFTVPLDVSTRNIFKKSLAGPLEAAIGKDALTTANAKSLREVAAGFRSVK